MKAYLDFVLRSWPLLLFGFATVFWGNLGQSFFISGFGLYIRDTLSLSAAAYGAVYSAATLTSGVFILLWGGLIDRWALPRFVCCIAVGLTLGCLALSFVQNIAMLFVGFFFLRLFGQGMMPHTAQTTMARYFDANRGKALSISSSGMPGGEIILPLVAAVLIASFQWRNAWLFFAVSIPLLYLPLSIFLLKKSNNDFSPHVESAVKTGERAPLGRRAVLSDTRFWLALPAVMVNPFILTGVFIQMGFIVEQKSWDPLVIATGFIFLGSVHWCTSMITGFLVDWFGAKKILPFIVWPLMLSLLSVTQVDAPWFAFVFMGLLGMNIGVSGPTLSALWAEAYGTARLGAIRSLLTGMMMLSTAAAPALFGVLIDSGFTLNEVFIPLGFAMMLFSFLAACSYPRYFSGIFSRR